MLPVTRPEILPSVGSIACRYPPASANRSPARKAMPVYARVTPLLAVIDDGVADKPVGGDTAHQVDGAAGHRRDQGNVVVGGDVGVDVDGRAAQFRVVAGGDCVIYVKDGACQLQVSAANGRIDVEGALRAQLQVAGRGQGSEHVQVAPGAEQRAAAYRGKAAGIVELAAGRDRPVAAVGAGEGGSHAYGEVASVVEGQAERPAQPCAGVGCVVVEGNACRLRPIVDDRNAAKAATCRSIDTICGGGIHADRQTRSQPAVGAGQADRIAREVQGTTVVVQDRAPRRDDDVAAKCTTATAGCVDHIDAGSHSGSRSGVELDIVARTALANNAARRAAKP